MVPESLQLRIDLDGRVVAYRLIIWTWREAGLCVVCGPSSKSWIIWRSSLLGLIVVYSGVIRSSALISLRRVLLYYHVLAREPFLLCGLECASHELGWVLCLIQIWKLFIPSLPFLVLRPWCWPKMRLVLVPLVIISKEVSIVRGGNGFFYLVVCGLCSWLEVEAPVWAYRTVRRCHREHAFCLTSFHSDLRKYERKCIYRIEHHKFVPCKAQVIGHLLKVVIKELHDLLGLWEWDSDQEACWALNVKGCDEKLAKCRLLKL